MSHLSQAELTRLSGYTPKSNEQFFTMDAQIKPRVNTFLVPNRYAAGPLTSTKPNTPGAKRDGLNLYGPQPTPDATADDGRQFCSINSLCRATGAEHGFALDQIAKKSLVPDVKLNGTAHWTAGDSAMKASTKLAVAHSIHLAMSDEKKSSNIKPRL